jgi:hypothetical protein
MSRLTECVKFTEGVKLEKDEDEDVRLTEEYIRSLYDLEEGDDYMPYDKKNVERLRKLSYEKYFTSEFYCIDLIEFLKAFKNLSIKEAKYYLLKCQAQARLDLYRRGRGHEAWDDYETDEESEEYEIAAEEYKKFREDKTIDATNDTVTVDAINDIAIANNIAVADNIAVANNIAIDKMTIVELRKKCKELGLKGYSKKNKTELLEMIKTNNL